ncbi:N-acylneuraminate cytidylyltransferase [Streptococcus suis]|nr:N-acylneuraminate cytidylyltransferase [Streptococcus suis]CYW17764.1 N-acylneuraminate cytidylyltransferase [Streptococcus suis]CYW26863.1 N-acylneuraminate cytidylyltransferase [Streptococcus suis]CYW88193.1 N-acylneuraminate cytidylyltransferase [Streptococcus suis]CYX02061.1 N-acylneuraminate cytidylyltransferase [Streptococcus suis]
MIFHTIDVAIESGCFEKEDIYVSTDSEMYKGGTSINSQNCEFGVTKALLNQHFKF